MFRINCLIWYSPKMPSTFTDKYDYLSLVLFDHYTPIQNKTYKMEKNLTIMIHFTAR